MDKKLRNRFYKIKERCYNPNNIGYKRYGGRGIRVCSEWLKNPELFEMWAYSHGYKPELQLDRIDNNGDYSPDNCRWVTSKQNNRNKGNNKYYIIDGVKRPLEEWSEIYGICSKTVSKRLERGMAIEDALTQNVRKRDKTSLVGQRFGRLTILRYADEYVGTRDESKWVCLCDCGNETISTKRKLISGRKKSCGCSQHHSRQ